MLPTPSTSHANYNHIYEPAEDSYLLLDTLSSPHESAYLKSRFPSTSTTTNISSPLILEIGPGSGIVLAFVTAHAQHIFGRSDIATLGADINPFACHATVETVRRASGEAPTQFLGCITGDLATACRGKSVDVLIFNPPYVPTEQLPPPTPQASPTTELSSTQLFDRDSRLLSLSYAGGLNGMETTNRLLQQIPDVLSERGVAYILLCAQNRPKDVVERIQGSGDGWEAEVVGSSGMKAGWEKLCIVRMGRSKGDQPVKGDNR